MPLEKENSAADPLYSSRLSQLAPHLSLPASATSPPIHSIHQGHAVLQSGIFAHSSIRTHAGSLLNSRSRGTLHHISNVASREINCWTLSSIHHLQQPGKEVGEGWAVLSQPLPKLPSFWLHSCLQAKHSYNTAYFSFLALFTLYLIICVIGITYMMCSLMSAFSQRASASTTSGLLSTCCCCCCFLSRFSRV